MSDHYAHLVRSRPGGAIARQLWITQTVGARALPSGRPADPRAGAIGGPPGAAMLARVVAVLNEAHVES